MNDFWVGKATNTREQEEFVPKGDKIFYINFKIYKLVTKIIIKNFI